MSANQNPKDALGLKKVSFHVVPDVALLHEAHAMMDGAGKYGPYNWRENSVIASIYLDALERHIKAWKDGQLCAEDSGVHHLGHARACLGILLDAEATGNLIDDRPIKGGAFVKTLSEINKKIAERRAQ